MKSLCTLLVVVFAAFTIQSCGTGSLKEESFYVRGNCDMCKDRLESGIKGVSGVAKAQYDVNGQILKVTYDTTITKRAIIEKQCAELGHGTDAYPMNAKNHEELPECCKVSHNEGKH